MSVAGSAFVLLLGVLGLALLVALARSSREGTTRAPWILAGAAATVIAYVVGAVIAYGDSDRDPNLASFASLAMVVLVVISTVIAVTRRQSRTPVILSLLALAVGVVGVTVTLVS